MRHFARFAAVAIAAIAGCLVPASVRATPVSQQTFTFSGACTDCSGQASATLVLEGYTLGTNITLGEFVSFSYAGTDLLGAFTITAADLADASNTAWTVGGNIPSTLPAFADFGVGFVRPTASHGFQSLTTGSWCAGDFNCLDDFGTRGTWSAAGARVPEPGALALAALGFAVAVAARGGRACRRQAA